MNIPIFQNFEEVEKFAELHNMKVYMGTGDSYDYPHIVAVLRSCRWRVYIFPDGDGYNKISYMREFFEESFLKKYQNKTENNVVAS